MARLVLYGSPHSLPAYKVASPLSFSGLAFSFRDVSFQRGMHKNPEFLALSRWGLVPVLIDGPRVMVQSSATAEHIAESTDVFRSTDPARRQFDREWVFWEADALFPRIFGCYGRYLGQSGSLPITMEPAIAAWHRRRAEDALGVLDAHLSADGWLGGGESGLPDLLCHGDCIFAAMSGIDLTGWPNLMAWSHKIRACRGLRMPLDLLPMADTDIPAGGAS